MRLQLLFKVIILLCSIQLLCVEAQSAYAQGGEGQSEVPELGHCNPIPAANCQITITDDQLLETAVERWAIQLDEDEPFSPTHVQRDELPASIAIVVDGSDVMRRGLLTDVFNSLSNLKEKLLEANPQITDTDIDKLLWSIFLIGAEHKDSQYTWCGDIEADDFDLKCDIWRKDSNLPGNTVYKFIQEYTAKPVDATPFVDPLEKVIGHFVNRTGPKHIICFCEGLDGGAPPDLEGTISLAQDYNIDIHVVHMWKKAPDKDATEPLKRLAEETGGEFVAIGGDVTPIWQAITRELIDYQYTLMAPLSKQSKEVLINYKGDEDNWISLAKIPFPEGLVNRQLNDDLANGPLPSAILEFTTDENGYVVVSQPERGNPAVITVQPPKDIGYELVPSSLRCEILGGGSFDMPTPTDMTCEIPIDEILDTQSELFVWLIDQFGREYSGQVPLRLVDPELSSSTEPSQLPLWGVIGLGIIFVAAMGIVASRLRNRQKEPDFEPDDDATERIGAGDFFPPAPLPDTTDATQRASYVLPVAKLTLKHAPTESRSTLASDITLYPDTLKWGIGRKKAVLLKEPEYTDAEPIEIEEKTISRVHALLEFNVEIEGFFLKSDMAPNGTFVNREQLEPLEPYPLQAGDEVQFGKISYKFEILEMDLRKAFIEFIAPGEDGSVLKGVNGVDVDQTAR